MNLASDPTSLLRLQQFSDSALPIGGAAHSFGLESLVDSALLERDGVEGFLADYLVEAGTLEAAYCAASGRLSSGGDTGRAIDEWLALSVELGSRKPARESRDGSAAMGRRFLDLAARVSNIRLLVEASERARHNKTQTHLAVCFGLVAGAMGIDDEVAAGAYLQQSITSLVSCCQRLLPLGQTQAHQILWNLKPEIADAARRGAATPPSSVCSFMPLVDMASARHPGLQTRLFMS
jgi:urease accessory protein